MRWHYTVGVHMRSILDEGLIRPATASVQPKEKPIVWFTTSSNWEETANKSLMHNGELIFLNRQQTEELCGGLWRIGVGEDYPLKRFLRISREAGQSKKIIEALVRVAQDRGSKPFPDWWGTFKPVQMVHWERIETHTAEGWCPPEKGEP